MSNDVTKTVLWGRLDEIIIDETIVFKSSCSAITPRVWVDPDPDDSTAPAVGCPLPAHLPTYLPASGIVLADHKREMVYNRLVRRLRLLDINDFGQYLALLESDPNSAEWQAFVNALTTNLTAFFREAHHFPILAEHARQRAGNYSVWSTAASTGEEPYSIAMTLSDALGNRAGSCQVLASDIDTQVLEKATSGVYRQDELRSLSAQQMQRYFLRGTGPHQGMVRVRPELANMIQFQQLNLLAPEWALPGQFDAIFAVT